MAGNVDKEIDAIGQIMKALAPLSEAARVSVIEYVTKRLGINAQVDGTSTLSAALYPSTLRGVEVLTGAASPLHITDLKKQKQPRSANEMAALVAYYLSEVVPPNARKQTINTEDVVQQFKIAKFSLPRQPKMTLANAKNAGYFDMAGNGEYRLNPVGYNLVEHGMPRGTSETAAKKRPRRKAKPKR